MSSDMEHVNPTRQELVRLRRRTALAESLVDIIKKDLEALMLTLFDLVKELQASRENIFTSLGEAYGTFTESEMIVGSKAIERASLLVLPLQYEIHEGTKIGVLGLEFPSLELEWSAPKEPRFNLMDTPVKLDTASMKIQEGLRNVVQLAEIEASIRDLLDVIALKKRQLARLEHRILPQLEKSITYVELILEETERQDSIRVRVLQRKRKERSSKR